MTEYEEIREKVVLSKEERDNCTPSDKQLEDFLAEPDDEVAAKLRKEDPKMFRVIGQCLLYGRNIAQAQLDKVLKDKRVWIECENQDLPENPYEGIGLFIAYGKGIADMLTPKDGCVWVKVIPKESIK